MDTDKLKIGRQNLKETRDSPSWKSLREILQQGAGSSGVPRSGPAATRVPAVEISAKGRDKPMVRYLTEVKLKIPLMGVSHTDIPLQGASTSSKPAVGEGQGHSISQTDGPRLAKKALSGCTRRKLKKARTRASEAETGGFQQPGNASAPKQGENSTKASKRPKSEGSTLTEMARDPKRPRDLSGPRTYKEALTNIKIAIFKESYPEDKLNEDDQKYILEELGKVLCRTPLEELSHLKSYRPEGGALIYMR
jgi:hypothetical protein